jgi:hypothetical protein
MGRAIYDKGWHGGNRAKAKRPEGVEQEDWIGCGDCKLPDSQDHWVRKCREEPFRAIRNRVKDQVQEQLQDIIFEKGNRQKTRDLFNICSEIVEYALHKPGGEQVWLGILPAELIDSIEPRMSITKLPRNKMSEPNRWRRTIKRLMQTLVTGARELWKRKEDARRDRFTDERTNKREERVEQRRKSRLQDIRVVMRKLARIEVQKTDIDNDAITELMNDTTTEPCMTNRLRRRAITATNPARLTQTKLRWTPSLDQEYFRTTRDHSNKMRSKISGGKLNSWRTIRHGTYERLANMDWLESGGATKTKGNTFEENGSRIQHQTRQQSAGGAMGLDKDPRNDDSCSQIGSTCRSSVIPMKIRKGVG